MKKIISLILAVSLCLALTAALASCGDGNTNDSGKPKYTVTFVDQDGKAVSGVNLMISDASFDVSERETSDENGKAAIEIDAEKNDLEVKITSVPTGYEMPDLLPDSIIHAKFGDKKEITITVNKVEVKTTTFKVKIVDQNGDAVKGVELQICTSVCYTCDLTDQNGITEKEISGEAEQYTLKILSAPEGYSFPKEGALEGGYHAAFADGETEIEFAITKN